MQRALPHPFDLTLLIQGYVANPGLETKQTFAKFFFGGLRNVGRIHRNDCPYTLASFRVTIHNRVTGYTIIQFRVNCQEFK